MAITPLQPADWTRPRGYANAMAADGPGRWIVVAGQIGAPTGGGGATGPLAAQCRLCFERILRLVREGGGGPEHVVRMTWFVVDRAAYLAEGRAIGEAWRDTFGKNFPAMTVIFVAGLIDPEAKVEIEAAAFVPAG